VSALLIHGGTVVSGERATPGNVLIEGERIVGIGPHVSGPAGARRISARGLLVLPGLIDPHVHLREPGATQKEDIATGTRAALAGGFTTVLMMPNTDPPITNGQTLSQVEALAEAKAACDFGIFVGATGENARLVANVKGAIGLKLYMGSSTGDLLVDSLAVQLAHFEQYPGVIAVHAEDEEAVSHAAGRGERRPPLCAVLAVARALALAERSQRRLHICHVSTAQELILIRDAKARGVPVTCEVTPHHLFLTRVDEVKLGALARMNPPLRTGADVEALWEQLETIDCLATDHAPHTLEEKGSSKPPAGVPGLETALPLLFTALGDIPNSVCGLVRLMAEGPARTFNLVRKGHLKPGYDADVTLVDPKASYTIGERPFFTKCGWSPFTGRAVRGRVVRVFLRGRDVYADGRIVEPEARGKRVEKCGP